MPALPDELRDRAAWEAWKAWKEEPCEMAMSTWCRVVDAVAEVLAEHQGAGASRVKCVDPDAPCGDCDQCLVAQALYCVEQGNAGHWPTVAGYLADEVYSLRVRVERAEADLARARAVVDAAEALVELAPRSCRYHGQNFTRRGLLRGQPRCDSCRLPFAVEELRAALARSVSPDHTGEPDR